MFAVPTFDAQKMSDALVNGWIESLCVGVDFEREAGAGEVTKQF